MRRVVAIVFLIFSLIIPSFAYALEVCPFSGQIDFLHNDISIMLGEKGRSSVSVRLSTLSEDHYQLKLNLDDLKTSLFEISTQLESSFQTIAVPPDKTFIKGKIVSHYSLFNRKPATETGELSGQFEIKNHILYLPASSMGEINFQGSVELFYPFKINLALQLDNMSMIDFLSVWVDNPDIHAHGNVSGVIQIAGIPGHLILKGNLATYDGAVEELEYDSIVLNLEGEYPVLKLKDSTVTKADGVSFNISGNFDLSHRDHFRKEIESLTKSPLVKEGNSAWEWTIKRKAKADVSTSEFKYFLHKKNSQENPLKEESDVMGVEQKIKF